MFFAVQAVEVPLMFVVFHMWDWAAPVPPLNPLIATYATFALFGSITTRPTYLLGI